MEKTDRLSNNQTNTQRHRASEPTPGH